MSSVARPSIRWPSKRTVPVGGTMPETARSVVVLPAPLAPRIVVMPPASTVKLTPWRTRVAPYATCRSCDLEDGRHQRATVSPGPTPR